YLTRAGVDLACLDQTVLSFFTRGDALYALPKGYTPLLVVYNKDLFDRARIPYPTDDWTWDDFLRIAQRLTRDTDGDGVIDQWGSYFDRRPFVWIPWIWAGGGDVLCPDGRRASGCLDGPHTIAAIRWYTGWITRYGIARRGEGGGLGLPALTGAAQALVARDRLGWEAAFLRAATTGRAPWGGRVERWRDVEAALPDLLDRITLTGADPAVAARELAREVDRLLAGTR